MAHALEWDIDPIVGTNIDADGFLEVQVDADGGQGSPPFEGLGVHGLFTRPLDPVVDPATGQPNPAAACPTLHALEGGKGYAIPLGDPRTIVILPTLAPGETVVYSDFGQFSKYYKDGSIAHCTTTSGGSSSGQTVAQWITPTFHQWFAPWGQVLFDKTGFRVKPIGGAQFALGTAGGIVPGLSSYARIAADMVEINGSAVTIGPTGAVGQPVVQAAPLVPILQGIVTALEAIQAALATATPASGITAAQNTVVASAVTLAQAQVASALATISTQTCVG